MDEPTLPVWMRVRASGVELAIRLVPRASRNAVTGVYGDRLKIALTAPPLEGAANLALQDLIARAARVPKGRVRIVHGLRDRSKVVLVESDQPATLAGSLASALAPPAKP